MILDFFEKEIIVYQYECDMNSIMKASSLLRRAQQISTEHCDAIGMTKEVYEKNHVVFILNKISLNMQKFIKSGDKLLLKTIPFYPKASVYNRYTEIYRSDELIASLDTRWILYDYLNKRILRNPPKELNYPFNNENIITHENMDIKAFDADFAGCQEAVYSITDLNGHINNADYADIIFNFLNCGTVLSKNLKRLVIAYRKEIKLSERADIFASKSKENLYYIFGEKDDRKAFEANVEFYN